MCFLRPSLLLVLWVYTRCELPRVVIGEWVEGSRRLSGGAIIARKPWPRTPTDTGEGPQRGLQDHERGSWRRIGEQRSYQVHAKKC